MLRSFNVYAAGLLAFLVIMVIAATLRGDSRPFVEPAIAVTVALAFSLLGYFASGFLTKRDGLPSAPVPSRVYETMFWVGIAASAAACVLFMLLAETAPAIELFRSLADPTYISSHTELEIRLATSLMPRWAEGYFELSRRLVLPLCGVLVVLGLVERTSIRIVPVVVIALFFVLSTFDRAVPVMYVALLYGARFMDRPRNILTDKWFYVGVVVVIVTVVGLKPIQYGRFVGIDGVANSEITEMLASRGAQQADGGNMGALTAESSENAEANIVSRYAGYAALSMVERLVLSPVTMVLYAFDSYDESNFQHWSSTRVFSLLGVGRYVEPLSIPTTSAHHDAFPVTFLGDLWRQGGFLYIPFYCFGLGIVLRLLDRIFFDRRETMWQPFIILGVAYLFYGNAFNATTIMLIGGSVLGLICTRLFPMFWPGGKKDAGDPQHSRII